jgi:hypothetical protein
MVDDFFLVPNDEMRRLFGIGAVESVRNCACNVMSMSMTVPMWMPMLVSLSWLLKPLSYYIPQQRWLLRLDLKGESLMENIGTQRDRGQN